MGSFKFIFAVLAVTAGSWLSASDATAYVFGKDDRVPLPREYSHLRYKIGFLHTRAGKYGCTASCVAKDMILTAAHCILGRRGKKSAKPQGDLKFFLPNKYVRSFYDIADVLHVGDYLPRNVFTGVGGRRTFSGNNNLDWAYVKLGSNACKHGSLNLKSLPIGEIAKAGKNGKLIEVAFHGDKEFGKTLFFTNKCRVKGVSTKRRRKRLTKTINHTCDMKSGASGSPLLMEVDGQLSIVGLNVAQLSSQRYLRRGRKIIKYYKSKPTHNVAVHPSRFIPHLEHIGPVKLVIGARRLEWIQRGLKERKLYAGKIDGVFGPATRNAIRKYERSVQLPVLGMPTIRLLDKIGSFPPTAEQSKEKTKTQLTEIERLREKFQKLWGKARSAVTLEIYQKNMERVTAIQNERAQKNVDPAADGASPPKP